MFLISIFFIFDFLLLSPKQLQSISIFFKNALYRAPVNTHNIIALIKNAILIIILDANSIDITNSTVTTITEKKRKFDFKIANSSIDLTKALKVNILFNAEYINMKENEMLITLMIKSNINLCSPFQ
jgi:hypothetical protein